MVAWDLVSSSKSVTSEHLCIRWACENVYEGQSSEKGKMGSKLKKKKKKGIGGQFLFKVAPSAQDHLDVKHNQTAYAYIYDCHFSAQCPLQVFMHFWVRE